MQKNKENLGLAHCPAAPDQQSKDKKECQSTTKNNSRAVQRAGR